MKKIDFKKRLPTIVIAILVIFFIVGLSWGLKSVLEIEGTMEPNAVKASLSPVPETKEERIRYVAAVLQKAAAERPATSFSDAYSIDADTIRAGAAQNAAAYIRPGIEDKLSALRENFSTDFGEDLSGKLRPFDAASGDIASAEMKYDFWQCPVCGKETDELPQICEDCGTGAGFLRKFKDAYTITLRVPDAAYPAADASFFARTFRPLASTEIDGLIRKNANGWFECPNGFAIAYRNIEICAVIDRLTDQIASITYARDCDFGADVAFTGAHAALQTQRVGFTVRETAAFTFTWPGISITAEELVLTPGQTDVLRAESPCADLTPEAVTWTSSDASIASVNDEGYVTAKHTTGQCRITAAFTFMGKTYTAACPVVVKVPAEKIDISRRKLTLSAGDTYTLSANVRPRKATIRTVKWYSDDEEIAAVSEDGTITAKRSGTVDVYAVSDDGYFKATCHVEVEP